MSRSHFALRYQLNSLFRFLIWYSNDLDGVVLDEQRGVPSFATHEDLVAYAESNDLPPIVEETPILHNLDLVERWLRRKRPTRPECGELLSAWNLFGDVSASIGGAFDGDRERTQTIYQKLFWGTNIPAITPPGKHYEPLWSGREYRIIRETLREGLATFRKCVVPQGAVT